MRTSTRILSAVSIVLAPLLLGIGDQVRMVADPPADLGIVSEYGVEEAAASLASIQANRPAFVAASYLMYLAMLLTIPALLAIWRMTVERAPRWAWAGAVLATLFVLGQVVHLVGHFAMSQVYAAHPDLEVAAELMVAAESNGFVLALFVPLYLLGLLAVVPQAVGLRRARAIPLWACVAVIAGTVVIMIAGSAPVTSAVWTLLLVAGFAPAALTMLRGAPEAATAGARPATATA